MRVRSAIYMICMALLPAACVPPPAPPLNSPVFATRKPLPGQPGYLETIRFIDNGVHYVSAGAGFFVSADGDMCFQGLTNPGAVLWVNYRNYWCISPKSVSAVDALNNDITSVNMVRLWCRHADPQCAHKIGYANMLDDQWIANSISAETVPIRQQRAAIEHLIYLMGGHVDSEALLR
jgi:hypothetical protein